MVALLLPTKTMTMAMDPAKAIAHSADRRRPPPCCLRHNGPSFGSRLGLSRLHIPCEVKKITSVPEKNTTRRSAWARLSVSSPAMAMAASANDTLISYPAASVETK
jgi:hypothetical protein